jgi:hypothetical protein
MSLKKSRIVMPILDGPNVPVGTKAILRRPNLWAGSRCEVLSFMGGQHKVLVEGPSGKFPALASSDELD